MNYTFRNGFKHKVDANVAGAVCEELEQSGGLTGERLVEASRPEDAPLHGEFEWDDSKAAESWRVQQARCIINSLIIVSPETNKETRKFVHLSIEKTPRYESIETVMQSVDKRDLLLRNAYRELSAFRKKYAVLMELSKVFDVIDGLEETA